jgi:hypothetical protein
MSEQTVAEAIRSLTPGQAQAAVHRFYELVPEQSWVGGRPSPADIKELVKDLRDESSPEIQSLIAELLEKPDQPAAGEIARILLQKFADQEDLGSYVERAVREATQRHMALDPVTITILIALAATRVHVKRAPGGKLQIEEIKLDLSANLTELVKVLTEFEKHLPGWIQNLLPKGGATL